MMKDFRQGEDQEIRRILLFSHVAYQILCQQCHLGAFVVSENDPASFINIQCKLVGGTHI